jgi:formylglycine-generating enzyme required for sulfatase activity
LLRQTLEFEVYPDDLGKFTWEDAKEACATLGEGWRLPTREELHLIWLNKDDSFAAAYYWSSSEYNIFHAWLQYFFNGGQYDDSKNNTYYVRAVRALTI